MILYAMTNGEVSEMSEVEIQGYITQQEIDSSREVNQSYRLHKSVFITRLTEVEAATMENVLGGAEPKLRLMFNSVEYFVSDDPLFDDLYDAVRIALSDDRATELLAPNEPS